MMLGVEPGRIERGGPFQNPVRLAGFLVGGQDVDFKVVKASVLMLQILDHYGVTEHFKRNNDSLSGASPLHNGENPAQFRVSVSKNCWNCFGQCKRCGNVLDFVALKERVVIPIQNAEGKLLADAGRWPGQAPEGTPKCKLPAGFKKSLELFSLHRALQQPKEQPLVIVEGCFDALVCSRFITPRSK